MIVIHLDKILAERNITLTELSEQVDISIVNLSNFKTGKGKAIRFSTLEALCKALNCQPGDLIKYESPL